MLAAEKLALQRARWTLLTALYFCGVFLVTQLCCRGSVFCWQNPQQCFETMQMAIFQTCNAVHELLRFAAFVSKKQHESLVIGMCSAFVCSGAMRGGLHQDRAWNSRIVQPSDF